MSIVLHVWATTEEGRSESAIFEAMLDTEEEAIEIHSTSTHPRYWVKTASYIASRGLQFSQLQLITNKLNPWTILEAVEIPSLWQHLHSLQDFMVTQISATALSCLEVVRFSCIDSRSKFCHIWYFKPSCNEYFWSLLLFTEASSNGWEDRQDHGPHLYSLQM